MEFLEAMKATKTYMADHTASETIDMLIKKIKYRDYLVKEEGNDAAADEKFENVGQIVNMAQKYDF